MRSKLGRFLTISLLAFQILLGGCGRKPLPTLEELIHMSHAVYLAEARDQGYLVTELLKGPGKPGNWPMPGELIPTGLASIKRPDERAGKIAVFVHRDAPEFPSGKYIGQTEVPFDQNGELAHYRVSAEQLRRKLLVNQTN